MVKASNTRELIVERARNLLRSHGYDGFSYQDISSHLGIRNAAVHYHFRSKEDLGLALIEEAAAAVRDEIRLGSEMNITAREQMEIYLCRMVSDSAAQEQQICPIGALSVNYGNISKPMQRCVTNLLEDVRTWMTKTLEQGHQTGEFNFAGSARDKAGLIMAAIQGARQIDRILENFNLQQVTEQIRNELYA